MIITPWSTGLLKLRMQFKVWTFLLAKAKVCIGNIKTSSSNAVFPSGPFDLDATDGVICYTQGFLKRELMPLQLIVGTIVQSVGTSQISNWFPKLGL